MNVITAAPRAMRQVTVADARGLARIAHEDANLVLWPRSPPLWLAELSRSSLDEYEGRACFERDEPPAVRPLLRGFNEGAAQGLAADIELLACSLFRVTRARHIDARFAVTRDDGCRKFHTDRRYARLLCTYLGPGTQWLTERAVDRRALCRDVPDMDAANDAIVRDWRRVRTVPTAWVALMKGDLWPGNHERGLVHRSPPIRAHGLTRVVLVLDAQL